MKTVLTIGLLAACVSAPAMAASDAATRFGAREDIQQMSLSPDGKQIAYIEPVGARAARVFVINVAGGAPVAVATSTGDPERLQYCRWSTNTRLVCSLYMTIDSGSDKLGYTRMISVDSDGKRPKLLSARSSSDATERVFNGGNVIDWSGDSDGTVLMTRNFVPEIATGTLKDGTREGFGVERVNTTTLARVTVEKPGLDAVEYIADGYGTVRIKGVQSTAGTGYSRNVVTYVYRPLGSREWQPLGKLTFNAGKEAGFNPYAIDHDKNLVYGFDKNGDHTALYSITLDSSQTKALVLARPDVDVDGLIRIGRKQRVVGASYATERRQNEFFDPELKKLATSLSRALPGLPLVTFIDASADESKLLLFAGSDTDPGHYYLYDKASRHLDQVSPARPQLAGVTLAAVKPITYPAADGTQIPGYLTLPRGATSAKGLPAIVMPHGGPGDRDEWGFDWLPQFFANRGYAVLQPNFRGSTGYGDAWFKDNGFKSWRIAIGDVNDGGRWLINQGIADPAHIAIVGWSYGGYAALQSAVLDPALFKAIVAVAPVTDLAMLRDESVEFTNHDLVAAFIGTGPHVVQGSPAQNAGRIAAPVLLFHGDHDQNVGIGESRLMASRLKSAGKSVELIEFTHLDHQLDDSSARAQMLDKMDDFLHANLHLPAMP
jgi:dipeptidyl aminopeptidase/acylaminoacyl peptidase